MESGAFFSRSLRGPFCVRRGIYPMWTVSGVGFIPCRFIPCGLSVSTIRRNNRRINSPSDNEKRPQALQRFYVRNHVPTAPFTGDQSHRTRRRTPARQCRRTSPRRLLRHHQCRRSTTSVRHARCPGTQSLHPLATLRLSSIRSARANSCEPRPRRLATSWLARSHALCCVHTAFVDTTPTSHSPGQHTLLHPRSAGRA